jgi:hypothetical protein
MTNIACHIVPPVTASGLGHAASEIGPAGFSKERRLEPQITTGLLAGQDGFSLMVSAFEGNGPRPRPCSLSSRSSWPPTSYPASLSSPTGMISGGQPEGHRGGGLSFILGMKIPDDLPWALEAINRDN